MPRPGTRWVLPTLVVAVAVAACGTSVSALPSPGSAVPGATQAASPADRPSAAPAAGSWVGAGTLELARASAHAVVLDDSSVLVVGNDNICTPGGAWDTSAQAELFDPKKDLWTSTGSLNAPRTDFAAVALGDGSVLVTGGLTAAEPVEGDFGAYSSAKLYDPATGAWSATGLMSTARTEPSAALLPDGRVLVAGGAYVDADSTRVLASAEIYDPASGEWSATGSMLTARRGAQSVALADGRVLVVGGSSIGRRLYEGYAAVASAEVFDPATGTWSPAGVLAAARQDFSLAALPDGGALVVGGVVETGGSTQATATVERFDPKTLKWPATGAMLTPASNRSVVVLGDGRVLLAGGLAHPLAGSGQAPAIADAELYDPVSGTWSAAAPLPEPREGGSFVTLADRSVLLVGGDGGLVGEPSTPWCPTPVAAALRYVPGNLAAFPPRTTPTSATVAKSNVARAKANPADAKKAAASITAFGMDLYRRMLRDGTLDPKKNAVFSPTSIALALAMARAGAKGETAAQMDAILHTSGWDALGPGLNALDQALASRDAAWTDAEGRSHLLALRIANAAFAQQGWSVLPGYLDAIASTFGAGLRLVDYIGATEAARQAINAWVKSKTAGRIPELLGQGTVKPDNRLWLVNAIYLKANWADEFEASLTKPLAFTRLDRSRVSVATMSKTAMLPYATGKGWTATELLYQGGDWQVPLAMTLIRPDDLASFEKQLTPGGLQAIISKLDTSREQPSVACSADDTMGCCHPYDVGLFLPRFSIESKADVLGSLAGLGMTSAGSSSSADFSGITSPSELFIAKVIHQANIDVDEKGTEAAAATAVGMSTTGGCGPSQPLKVITLRFDRPFLFLIRDVETGAILFMGRVVDPSAKG